MNTLRWKWMLLTASWPLHLCFSRHSHSSLFFISGSNSNYSKLNHSENWNLTVMRVLYCVKVNPGREMKKRDYLKRGCCICAAGHTHTQTRHHYHWFQLGESFQSILKFIFLTAHHTGSMIFGVRRVVSNNVTLYILKVCVCVSQTKHRQRARLHTASFVLEFMDGWVWMESLSCLVLSAPLRFTHLKIIISVSCDRNMNWSQSIYMSYCYLSILKLTLRFIVHLFQQTSHIFDAAATTAQ